MKRNILIVDGNKINPNSIHKILEDDYRVSKVENGKTAIDDLSQNYKDIAAVIIHICMPEMNGYEVLKFMRDNNDLANIPVIISTDDYDIETEKIAFRSGANDFLYKPYDADIIKYRVWNIINLREKAATVNAIKTDPLTGLMSRNAFFAKASAMIAKHEPGYYVMASFDVDKFKVINDQYGTQKGDEVLRYIADTLRNGFSQTEGICSRICADDFAVLYPLSFTKNKKIDQISSKAALLGGMIRPITFSIGRYIVDDLSLPAEAMYDRALLAEYSVKGRYDMHVAVYDDSMRMHIINEQEIISEMDEALENHHFEVWFQPQYNHASGALIGAEALVRWRHPEKGLISPARFIPVFERNGFIYELDKYVWKQACKYLRKWLDEEKSPVAVSVNISRYDLFCDDIVDVISGYVKEYDIPIDLLRLEITESAFAKSADQIIKVVNQFVSLGFIVEIDDFGSGYSSLNTLKDVPSQVLKLDMKFLEGDSNSTKGGNILQSVIRMAKWIGLSVIAEGVETLEQADYLRSVGCYYIQGYFYAKPMCAEDYENAARKIIKEEKTITLETIESLDNDSFWDPESVETLIFNSYVGGACILEYYHEKSEILRANSKFAEVIGGAAMTVEDVLSIRWQEHLDDENIKKLNKHAIAAINTKREVTDEYVFFDLPGCKEKTYIRSTVRSIASVGDRYLLYCLSENVTAQRIAEQRKDEMSEHLNLIMNNINGGITATIVKGTSVEFIFTNDKYYEIFGYTRKQYQNEVTNSFELIREDERNMVISGVHDVISTGNPSIIEYHVRRRDGKEICVRAVVSAARFEGINEIVELSVFRDITEEKLAEKKLIETDEHLHFLNSITHDMLSQYNSSIAIENVLIKLLNYFKGNRVYIFEFDNENMTANNTYEVCADNIESQKHNLQDVPLEVMSFWIKSFEHQNYISIPDVALIDDTREKERRILMNQGIKSLVSVALRDSGRLIGFIGIDDPTQKQKLVERFDALGDYIVVMLTRRDLDAKILSDNRNLRNLMEDTPGGFAKYRVFLNGDIRREYVNRGYCEILGVTHEEAMESADDATVRIHPDDVEFVRASVNKIISTGQTMKLQYRILNKKGEYIWLLVYGRVAKDEVGDTYINAYYTNITE